jgi:hypothetical protein
MGQDENIFSLAGGDKSARKKFALLLGFFVLITSCGGSTGTDGSGASSGTDYGKKTVYDANWRIVYYVEKDKVYTRSWSLAYHLEDNRVYDTSWRLVARIDGDRIYSENWSLLYRIDRDRVCDPKEHDFYHFGYPSSSLFMPPSTPDSSSANGPARQKSGGFPSNLLRL